MQRGRGGEDKTGLAEGISAIEFQQVYLLQLGVKETAETRESEGDGVLERERDRVREREREREREGRL